MTISFIWIKIFYDSHNFILSKGDHRKTVIFSFERINIKFASIGDHRALFSKEIVKDLNFLFEICNVIIVMNWWNMRYFLIL